MSLRRKGASLIHLASKGVVSRKSVSSVGALIRHSTPIAVLPWLTGWKYRKSHIIEPASGAGTNYQIKIKAHYKGMDVRGAGAPIVRNDIF